jgi:hypothetical protein
MSLEDELRFFDRRNICSRRVEAANGRRLQSRV